MPLLIAFEGGDGTGKTVTAANLAERIGAIHTVTPPAHFAATRDKVDRTATPDQKYDYYKEGTLFASREIAGHMAAGRDVVIDRFWLTTYTYHELLGVPVAREDFAGIVEPDLTIFLALNNEVQLQRMRQRGLSVRDRNTINQQADLAEAFHRNILKFSIPFVSFDTQRFDETAVLELCVASIDVTRKMLARA